MKPIQLGVVLICLCCAVRLSAQSLRLSVSGKITDSLSNVAMPFATVLLFNQNSDSALLTQQADKDGNFTFDDLKPGKYQIRVQYLGYKVITTGTILLDTRSVTLPAIALPLANLGLKGVQVTALKPLIEQSGDKLILNVSESALAAGSTLEELLRRSPGVKVNDDGTITLNGKHVMLYINDRPTYLSAGVLQNLLYSTSSSTIDKIELISNPSVKYDAAAAAVINIKMKKSPNIGMNGSVNASAGGGHYARATGGGDLNYRDEKLNIYGNYNYQRNNQYYIFKTDRIYGGDASPYYINESSNEVRKRNIHNANAGLSYVFDPHNNIGVDLKGNFVNRNRNSDDKTAFKPSPTADIDSLLQLNLQGHASFNSYAGNLFYQHIFDTSAHQLSINADYYYFNQHWKDNFNTAYLDHEMKIYQQPYLLRNSTPLSIYIRSLSADYSYPTRIGQVEAGLKTVFVKTDSDNHWETENNGTWELDETRTNHFIYNENVNAGYINYRSQFKKLNVQAGVRVENTRITGNSLTLQQVFKKDYTGIYPGITLQYRLSAKQRFSLAVRRSIDRPEYQYVNPFMVFRSKYNYFQGNPDLNPQHTVSVDLTHSYHQHLFTTLTLSRTNHAITGVYKETADKVLVTTYENVQQYDMVNLNITYSTALTKYWNTVNSFQGYYLKYHYGDVQLQHPAPGAVITSTNNFSIPKICSLELTGLYCTPFNSGLTNITGYWLLNIGVQRSVMKNKGTVKLSVNDVFKKQTFTIGSEYAQLNVHQYFNYDTRLAMLSFTWRFGNTKVKPKTERQTGIEKEKKRIGEN